MGWPKAVPLETLQEKGFLENDKLIVNVQVKVAQVVEKDMLLGMRCSMSMVFKFFFLRYAYKAASR